MEVDSGIRVTVVPSQSAFFAGEPFSITVTFTNTRSPTSSAKRTVSHTHKRGVHSISSAPLARPPTSPVTPRTAVPPIAPPVREGSKLHKKKYERKGIIGIATGSGGLGRERVSHSLQRWKGKSLSVSLSPQDIDEALATPSTPPPLRDGSVPANHPHARRQSVQDVHLETQLQVKELSSPALAPSGSASTSAFSLSLDTISETNSDTHQYPPKRRPPNLGLGLGPPPPIGQGELKPPHSAYPSTFAQPGTELVLYAYAQLSGTVTLGGEVAQGDGRAQALNAVRLALQKKQAFGGGRMDISSTLDGRPAETSQSPRRSRVHGYGHNRATSLSSSLMSLLSPPPPTHQPWSPGHKPRSPSLIASLLSTSVSSPASFGSSGTSAATSDLAEEVSPDTPLPVFEVQPAMLAVDLILAPGESRTYTYSLPLPSNLPPTYRGRNIKFAYHLSVGVCRSTPGPGLAPAASSPTGKGSTSQVMRVPIRVYNHVDVSGIQSAYDLLWPVLHPSSKEQTAQVRETTISSASARKESKIDRSPSTYRTPSQSQVLSPRLGVDPALELRDYALRLLNALPDSSGDGVRLPADIEALSPTSHAEREIRSRGGGELTGCREAVEILTRNMRKVSYDINKDGVKVAVLTFTKSAYRLGETVTGVVELNEISSKARVLKLSAMLESHETLPSSLNQSSQPQPAKKLRKLHAEYHTSLTLSTLRTSFALDIPSDATPAFQYVCAPPFSSSSSSSALLTPSISRSTSGLLRGEGTPGGLTWTVRLCLLVGVASPYARKGVAGGRVKGLLRDGPHGEWGTAWRATRGIAPLQNIDTKALRRAQQREALAASRSIGNGSASASVSGAGTGPGAQQQRGWASYFLSGLLTPGEREYHDGDEDIDVSSSSSSTSTSPVSTPKLSGVRELGQISETRTIRGNAGDMGDMGDGIDGMGGIDLDPGGGDEGWSELRAETVECEVPIRVWPGNTAFRPLEVVFDV